MAINTYKTALMKKGSGSSYEKLVDIKSYPDLGGTPEMLETTTLSDKGQTFIPGIDSADALEFTANYTKTDYETLLDLKGQELDLAVWFGGTESAGVFTPTGSDGKFAFKGYVSVVANGGDVNAVREMTISIAPSSAVEYVTAE